ncbi:hypothetical protein [Parvicella tangerina]|uniref:Lipoprotein n=1 Tax=Parvicella tangerina TaxID=2829795 RepID=A0A916JLF4_9FLAO|nr:hypothetical protein [Parvicella tangerina]CAG5079956.1 hypothetical protein CRYO30217_01132 [Parvicella tangerina]
MINTKIQILMLLNIILLSCNNSNKRAIIEASREASLGEMSLKLYDDQTFELESRGLRQTDRFFGTYTIINDTITFSYHSIIPKAGNKAVITPHSISYFNGVYSESMKITLNKL